MFGEILPCQYLQEISNAYNAGVIVLDTVIHEAIMSGTQEAGIRARDFCNQARIAAAEEDAIAQSAVDGKGRPVKGGMSAASHFFQTIWEL